MNIQEKIDQVYKLSVDLYYDVADDRMKRCGHPGHMGSASDEPLSKELSVIEGAIATLKDVADRLRR